MILDYEKFKPIKTFGIVLITIGIAGCLTILTKWEDPEIFTSAWVFIALMTMWHLVTGIGILVRKKWGFYLLKLYLYVLYLGIPIGTLLAKRILRYIKENEIELFFGGRGLEL